MLQQLLMSANMALRSIFVMVVFPFRTLELKSVF